MSTTSNYNLYVTDDSTTLFSEWRAQLSGTKDSNMTKIDEALGNKADSSTLVEATLKASAWVGTSAPYTQTISVTGLLASQNGTISVSHAATLEQREIARDAMLSVVGQAAGSLTVAADGDLPEKDIPVYILLLG